MFSHVASVSDACCKRVFKMFHLFQTYVASVLNVAYVSHMLQHYVPNVSAISVLYCSKCLLQVFNLDVIYVSHICCMRMF